MYNFSNSESNNFTENQLRNSQNDDLKVKNFSSSESNVNIGTNKSLPKAPRCNEIYSEFYKLVRTYYKELKAANIDSLILSKDDILIIDDIISEICEYCDVLIKGNYYSYALELIEIGIDLVDKFLVIINKSLINVANNETSTKMKYPLNMKLNLLESKFHILFDTEDLVNAEKILEEVFRLQKITLVPDFLSANNLLYSAFIKLSKIVLNYIFILFCSEERGRKQ